LNILEERLFPRTPFPDRTAVPFG